MASVLHLSSKLVVSASSDTSVLEATNLMATKEIGFIVVCDDGDAVIGVLSERDIVRAISVNKAKALDLTINDIMTRNVITCNGTAHPQEILTVMYKKKIRHMPVVDNGKLKGVISTRDILKYLSETTSPDQQAMMWAKLTVF
jgi:CBS domain-containing protein